MSITRIAPAPTRATSSVVLSAGLMNIPLSIFTSVESTSVSRREFYRGDADIPVGRVAVRRDTGAVIEPGDVTRMAESSTGKWVVLDDAEVVDCVGLTGGCEVVTFVPIADADKYLTESLYQVRPKNDKKFKAASDAAFSLLLAGMRARKVHALVRFAMRGVPRHALLTAEGDLLVIATSDAVRSALPMPDVKHAKAEVDMVVTLIDAIGVGSPVVVDTVAAKVQKYVDDKAGKGAPVTAPATAQKPTIVDLTAVLSASIDAAKAKSKSKAKGKAA